jgi:hypothetical protein
LIQDIDKYISASSPTTILPQTGELEGETAARAESSDDERD